MPYTPFDRQRVATVYVAALELEIPVIATLCDVLKVSDGRARYMTRTIREDGFLGRPPHHPAKATVHRNTYKERTWVVCQECLTRWPCNRAVPQQKTEVATHEPPRGPQHPPEH